MEKGKRVIEYLCPCFQKDNKDKKIELKNSPSKIEDITNLDFRLLQNQLTKKIELSESSRILDTSQSLENSKDKNQKEKLIEEDLPKPKDNP